MNFFQNFAVVSVVQVFNTAYFVAVCAYFTLLLSIKIIEKWGQLHV